MLPYEQAELLQYKIDTIAGRIHYAESRRASFSVIGGVLIAGGVTFLPYVTAAGTEPFIRIAGTGFSLCILVLGILLLVMYARQTNPKYPFTEKTKTWKWFYRDAIPDTEPFTTKWWEDFYYAKKKHERAKQAFDNQWPVFEAKQNEWLCNFDVHRNQDLQQIYVLHINEKYKNDQLRHFRTVLFYGLLATMAVTSMAAGYGYVASQKGLGVKQSSFSSGDVTLTTSWRESGTGQSPQLGRSEVQLLVNYRLTNSSSKPIEKFRLYIVDRADLEIPVVWQHPATTQPVGPKAQVRGSGLLWVDHELLGQVKEFRVE